MASAFTHGVVAAALAAAAPREIPRLRLTFVLVFLSVAPDFDVIAFRLGIPYEHPLGHRGFTHSLLFAALCGLLAPSVFPEIRTRTRAWWTVVLLATLATASHGLLDAFTDAGLGVGFFIPFSSERTFFPWRPLRTSPLSPSAFFSAQGLGILANEVLWVWLPLGAVVAITRRLRRGARKEPRG